jgi:hypothetical protein|tara:strand:+ start:395 stop:784 length:390 start_codon:yes stop_codon:yes gene_type:complete
MKRKYKYLGSFILASILVTSCATISRSQFDGFVINANVSNVSIDTSHGYSCTTPCAMNLPRNLSFTVTATKSGYCKVEARVGSSTTSEGSLAMAGNVIAGGVVGAIVDSNRGSTKSLFPNPLNIIMEEC